MPCENKRNYLNSDGDVVIEYLSDLASSNPLHCFTDTLSQFESSTPSRESKGLGASITLKDKHYLIGGYNGSTEITSVYVSTETENGELGFWRLHNSIPVKAREFQTIVTHSKVYVYGGYSGGSASTRIFSADILDDGVLSEWTSEDEAALARVGALVASTRSKVFIIGGYDGSGYPESYMTADINYDGTISEFSDPVAMPRAMYGGYAFVTKDRLYTCCARDDSSDTVQTMYATIDSNGDIGSFSDGGNMQRAARYGAFFHFRNMIVAYSGYNGSYHAKVQKADIDDDGIVGAWAYLDDLDNPCYAGVPIVTPNRMYIIGGHDSSSWKTDSVEMQINCGWTGLDTGYNLTRKLLSTDLVPEPAFMRVSTAEIDRSTKNSLVNYILEYVETLTSSGIDGADFTLDPNNFIYDINRVKGTTFSPEDLQEAIDLILDVTNTGNEDIHDKYFGKTVSFLRVAKRLNKIIYPYFSSGGVGGKRSVSGR